MTFVNIRGKFRGIDGTEIIILLGNEYFYLKFTFEGNEYQNYFSYKTFWWNRYIAENDLRKLIVSDTKGGPKFFTNFVLLEAILPVAINFSVLLEKKISLHLCEEFIEIKNLVAEKDNEIKVLKREINNKINEMSHILDRSQVDKFYDSKRQIQKMEKFDDCPNFLRKILILIVIVFVIYLKIIKPKFSPSIYI